MTAWQIAADADDLNLHPLSGAQRKWSDEPPSQPVKRLILNLPAAARRIAEFCSISLLPHPELIAGGAGVSLFFPATRKSNAALDVTAARGEGESMPSLKRSILAAFDDFRASGLLRPAAEKFAGAWLACFLVMARGD